MAALIFSVTKSTSPQGKVSETSRDIVVVSDKWVIEPIDSSNRSLIMVNGWVYESDADAAQLGTALSAADATVYTGA